MRLAPGAEPAGAKQGARLMAGQRLPGLQRCKLILVSAQRVLQWDKATPATEEPL